MYLICTDKFHLLQSFQSLTNVDIVYLCLIKAILCFEKKNPIPTLPFYELMMMMIMMMMMMMMMMIVTNCFCRMIDQWKAISAISSWDHLQRFSQLQISDILQAGFEYKQNMCS